MAKGSPLVALRFEPELLEKIKSHVDRVNATRAAEPYTLSSWIRHCVLSELSHQQRALDQRDRRRAKKAGASAGAF